MLGFDVRYALRAFRREPLFVAIAVLSLSIGIGANTAIFSLIDQLLLRLLPVKDPQQLVQLAARGSHYGSNWGMNAMSYPMYRDFRDQNQVFSGVMCRFGTPVNLGYGGRTERIEGELVSGNYFSVLGVGAALGRTISNDDDRTPGAHPVAVLSYDFWKSRFNSDPEIVGKTIHINSGPMTVIGVAAPGFEGVQVGAATEVFVPVMMYKQIIPTMSNFYNLEDRRGRWVNTFARLRPGVSIAQAKASLEPLYKQIISMEVREAAFRNATEYTRKRFLESRMEVMPGATGRSFLRRRFTTPLYVLFGMTALVLLIACANVANLLIARATARRKEIAMRLALGAGRWNIVRQLLVESALLAGASAVAGLCMGIATVRLLLGFVADQGERLTIRGDFDLRILGFSLGLALLTAVIFGLAPALQSARSDVAATLKDEAGGVLGGASARFRKGLVIAQVSLSLLLLIASVLFVRSLANLRRLDPGFETRRVVAFSVDPPLNGYDAVHTAAFYRQLSEAVAPLPAVQASGYGVMRLLAGDEWDSTVTVEGYRAKQGENMNPYFNSISQGYFAALEVPLVAGRDFTPRDEKNAPKVCIVNQAFVRKYFRDGNAVGRHIGQGGDPGTKTDIEIVGVVRDTKYENMRETTQRQVFLPVAQLPVQPGVVFYVRTTGDPRALYSALRSTVRNIDANLPVYGMRTLEQDLDRSLVTERMIASLSAAFGAVATLLAVIGLYGIMVFTVARRSREIGIRVALGAQPHTVVGLILRDVAFLVAAGVVIALPAYFGLARLVRSQLYGIASGDLVTIIGATSLLCAVAMLAGYAPARRAARLDPVRVLRYE